MTPFIFIEIHLGLILLSRFLFKVWITPAFLFSFQWLVLLLCYLFDPMEKTGFWEISGQGWWLFLATSLAFGLGTVVAGISSKKRTLSQSLPTVSKDGIGWEKDKGFILLFLFALFLTVLYSRQIYGFLASNPEILLQTNARNAIAYASTMSSQAKMAGEPYFSLMNSATYGLLIWGSFYFMIGAGFIPVLLSFIPVLVYSAASLSRARILDFCLVFLFACLCEKKTNPKRKVWLKIVIVGVLLASALLISQFRVVESSSSENTFMPFFNQVLQYASGSLYWSNIYLENSWDMGNGSYSFNFFFFWLKKLGIGADIRDIRYTQFQDGKILTQVTPNAAVWATDDLGFFGGCLAFFLAGFLGHFALRWFQREGSFTSFLFLNLFFIGILKSWGTWVLYDGWWWLIFFFVLLSRCGKWLIGKPVRFEPAKA